MEKQKITRKQDSIDAGKQKSDFRAALDAGRVVLHELKQGADYQPLAIETQPMEHGRQQIRFTIATRRTQSYDYYYQAIATANADFTHIYHVAFGIVWKEHGKPTFHLQRERGDVEYKAMYEWAQKTMAFYRSALIDGLYSER
jgi:hypothetical protein